MQEKRKSRRPRLASKWDYKKYPWYDCILKAKERKRELEAKFDVFSRLSLASSAYREHMVELNKELEMIDDYFDWLQIVSGE